MIIHIGGNIALLEKDIVAILDVDSALESEDSQFFINTLIKSNHLINKQEKNIKSYIITVNNNIDSRDKTQRYNLYTSNISSTSLLNRINKNKLDWGKFMSNESKNNRN